MSKIDTAQPILDRAIKVLRFDERWLKARIFGVDFGIAAIFGVYVLTSLLFRYPT